jgi:hypothetical protein
MSGLLLLKIAAACRSDRTTFRGGVLPHFAASRPTRRARCERVTRLFGIYQNSLRSRIKIRCAGEKSAELYFPAAPDSFTTFAHFLMSAFR